jgi:hypothetical protein
MVTYQRPRETITVIERAEDGRERRVIATRGHPNSPGHWDIVTQEANGQNVYRTFNGNRREVVMAAEHQLDRTRNDFKNDYKQSHAVYDKVVSVDTPPAYVGGYAAVQHNTKR